MTFKAQGTTLNSYSAVETKLYNGFTNLGYPAQLAKTVAHSFTHYMLDYLTAEGVARALVDAGADENTTRKLVTKFQAAKRAADAKEAEASGTSAVSN